MIQGCKKGQLLIRCAQILHFIPFTMIDVFDWLFEFKQVKFAYKYINKIAFSDGYRHTFLIFFYFEISGIFNADLHASVIHYLIVTYLFTRCLIFLLQDFDAGRYSNKGQKLRNINETMTRSVRLASTGKCFEENCESMSSQLESEISQVNQNRKISRALTVCLTSRRPTTSPERRTAIISVMTMDVWMRLCLETLMQFLKKPQRHVCPLPVKSVIKVELSNDYRGKHWIVGSTRLLSLLKDHSLILMALSNTKKAISVYGFGRLFG